MGVHHAGGKSKTWSTSAPGAVTWLVTARYSEPIFHPGARSAGMAWRTGGHHHHDDYHAG